MTDDRFAAVLLAAVVLAGCGAPVGGGATGADLATPSETPGGGSNETVAPDDDVETGNGTLSVHFLHVGQGASALLVGPSNETMLIDTGDYTDDGAFVLDALSRRNVTRIDHLVLTRAHADHAGGHAAVIEHFETEGDGVGVAYDPGIAASTNTYAAYLDAVEEHDVTLYETRAGDPIEFAGVDVEVLAPPEPYLAGGDRNENSIALRVSHGNVSFLFTGDGEDALERHLVETYGDRLRSTVLEAGHHGANGSNGPAFLDAVRPNVTVISSAYHSLYGHSHPGTLDRLAARSVRTYWTGTHGDVVITSDGETATVATQRPAPTDPLDLRDGNRTDPAATDPVTPRVTITPGGGNATTPMPDGDIVETATPENRTATRGNRRATDAPDNDTDAGDGALAVERVNADAAGDDRENLNGEYVVFRNDGDDPLDLSGWTVSDESGATYDFPDGFALDPGANVTLYTGSGTDTDDELYWGSGRPVWNNGGDAVVVTNAEGERVLTHAYP